MPNLTDTAIRNAKPGEKPYKLSDGDGLYLLVNAVGKYWRFNYRFAGQQKTLAFGVYPDLTLKAAREKLAEARRLLANDIDPSIAKRVQKAAKREAAANSFEAVAREWFAKYSPTWAISHANKVIARLEKDVLPWMGRRPISEITPPELLAVMRRIGGKLALTAKAVLEPIESLIDRFHERQDFGRHIVGWQADIKTRGTDVLCPVGCPMQRPDRETEDDHVGSEQEQKNRNDDPDNLLEEAGQNVVDDHIAMRQLLRDLYPDRITANILAGTGAGDRSGSARGRRLVGD